MIVLFSVLIVMNTVGKYLYMDATTMAKYLHDARSDYNEDFLQFLQLLGDKMKIKSMKQDTVGISVEIYLLLLLYFIEK